MLNKTEREPEREEPTEVQHLREKSQTGAGVTVGCGATVPTKSQRKPTRHRAGRGTAGRHCRSGKENLERKFQSLTLGEDSDIVSVDASKYYETKNECLVCATFELVSFGFLPVCVGINSIVVVPLQRGTESCDLWD